MCNNASSVFNADPRCNTVLAIHMCRAGLPIMVGEFGDDHDHDHDHGDGVDVPAGHRLLRTVQGVPAVRSVAGGGGRCARLDVEFGGNHRRRVMWWGGGSPC